MKFVASTFAKSALVFLQLSCTALASQATWDFESGKPGQPVTPKAPLRSDSPAHSLLTVGLDSAPTYTDDVPFKSIPQTGRANNVAIDNSAEPGNRMPTRDLYLSDTHAPLGQMGYDQWTLQACVNFKPVQDWQRKFQTFIGRDGFNIPQGDALHEDGKAYVGFKKRGDNNCLSIEAFDDQGRYVVVQSPRPVAPNTWYCVAAVADGKTLSLYVKSPDDSEYVLEKQADFHGTLVGNTPWAIGRGMFLSQPTEQCFGLIDEVSIANQATPPDHFIGVPRGKSEFKFVDVKPVAQPLPTRAAPPLPDNLVRAHDPELFYDGKTFHIVASHEGIVHYTSTDLLNWTRQPPLLPQSPQWVKDALKNDRPGIWAPSIARLGDQFGVFYSGSTFGSQRSTIGLLTASSLDAKSWKDAGKIVESFPRMPFNAIDPALVTTPDGKLFMAWGSWNRGIYGMWLDPKTGQPIDENAKPFHLAARPGSDALEAPYIHYHDGYYHLYTSFDFCCRGGASTYKLMVGRSKEITGPYVDRDGKPLLEGNASLVIRSCENWIGPGQCSVAEKDGKLWFAHHYYEGRMNGMPIVAIRPLYFDADGWPLVGEPLAESAAKSQANLTGRWLMFLDYVVPQELSLGPQGVAHGAMGDGTWSSSDQKLTVKWSRDQVIDDCVIAPDRNSFVGRRSDGRIVRAVRIP